MVDAVLVRGLLRYFAGTVVLNHNATFSLWRRSAECRGECDRTLLDDQQFLAGATEHLVWLCQDIGCTMPGEFAGLSSLSSIDRGSSITAPEVCRRFQADHHQMALDAEFLLRVVPFQTLPPSASFLSSQSDAHSSWSQRWVALLQHH